MIISRYFVPNKKKKTKRNENKTLPKQTLQRTNKKMVYVQKKNIKNIICELSELDQWH